MEAMRGFIRAGPVQFDGRTAGIVPALSTAQRQHADQFRRLAPQDPRRLVSQQRRPVGFASLRVLVHRTREVVPG